MAEKALKDAKFARETSGEFVDLAKGKIGQANAALSRALEEARDGDMEAVDAELVKAGRLRDEAAGLIEGSAMMDPGNPDLAGAREQLDTLERKGDEMPRLIALAMPLTATVRAVPMKTNKVLPF